jgi:hypothetical protein
VDAEIIEARGDDDFYPDVHFLEGKLVTVGAMRVPRRTPNATNAHYLLRELLPRSRSSIH